MKKVNNDFRQYAKNGSIATSRTNSVGFDNQGTVTAFINNIWRIKPGEFKSLSQLIPDVIDDTRYEVSFSLTDPYTTGTEKNLVVITSIYAYDPSQKLPNDANTRTACPA